MATGSDDGAGGAAKKQRVDEHGGGGDAVAADAIPADRISALPDELRQRILTLLPLKDAIRTGALASGWRGLWTTRWPHRSSREVHLRSSADLLRLLKAVDQEPLPRRRLDRLSLIVQASSFKPKHLRRFIEYGAECRVEDLHIETRTIEQSKLKVHLPLSSPDLACLSLDRINMSNLYYKGAQPFLALEVIQLYSVSIPKPTLRKMMELCPNLLTLDLRDCYFHLDSRTSYRGISLSMPPRVRRVTLAECDGNYPKLSLTLGDSVRSFCYSGDFCSEVFVLPQDATMLADLYIRSTNRPVLSQRDIDNWRHSFPKVLPGLNVLTICCNALRVASSYWLPNRNRNLHTLRELQLLMSEMEAINLADLYVFLKTCSCPNLKRLFVQLPTSSDELMEHPTDGVREEPPQDGFDNLEMVKVMNFNWRPTEVQLVSFLLRKASSVSKLSIVSPNVTPLDLPGVQEADLCLLKESLANGKIMLSESDDAATQPYHSQDITKFQ